jgi:pimeloyl-ACP methyl ester carboxylesterase
VSDDDRGGSRAADSAGGTDDASAPDSWVAAGRPTDAALLDHPPAGEDPPAVDARSERRDVGEVSLHVVVAGPADGPPVVLLHGFPDLWWGWRDHVARLADAGFRVLAPDLRGYNLSDRPSGVAAYRLERLTADVAGLVATTGEERAHVVGHDWGGVVAWDLALRRPGALDRLAVLNAPHPSAFRGRLTDPRQLLRSWYVAAFQVPRVPEWLARRGNFRPWRAALRNSGRPDTFADAELARYVAAWDRPRAPAAMLHYYRALLRYRPAPPRERVAAPTLVAWGERDDALRRELAPDSLVYCDDGRLERFPAASHWLQRDEPAAVSDLLVEHLRG